MRKRDAGDLLKCDNAGRVQVLTIYNSQGSAPALGDRVAYVIIKGIKGRLVVLVM